jgi:hypothetical protein
MVLGIDTETTQGKAVAVGVGALALSVAGLGVYSFHQSRLRAARRRRKKSKEQELTLEKTVAVLRTCMARAKQSITRVAEQETKVRQTYASQGQPISDAQILEFCRAQFYKMQKVQEDAVYRLNRTSERAMKVAVLKYADDDGIVKAIAEMQKLVDILSPREKVEIPASFGVEGALAFMQDFMGGLSDTCDEIATMLEAGGDAQGSATYNRELRKQFSGRAEGVSEKCLEKHKITQEILQAALQAYSKNPKFASRLQAMTQEHQKRLAARGLA